MRTERPIRIVESSPFSMSLDTVVVLTLSCFATSPRVQSNLSCCSFTALRGDRWNTPCAKKREYSENSKNMIDCEYADGSRYIGEHKNGTYHGHGTYIYGGGAKYVGEYKNGEVWNGIVYDKNGNIKGTWVNGVKQ